MDDVKNVIHCLKDNECSKDTCDFYFHCLYIKAKLRKGRVRDFRGKWHKATKEEVKYYERNFGKEWVRKYLQA